MIDNKTIQKLVIKAQAGDQSALTALYNNFFNQIYYYTYSRINSVHDAQEIVSDVFLSMVESIKKFKGQSSFKNYVFGITKNKIRDYIRNKYKFNDYILQSNLSDVATFDNLEEDKKEDSEEIRNYRNKIRKLLGVIQDRMKPRYAKVLKLRFDEMYTVEETANIMGTSTNNIKVIQHRAIKQAKGIWDELEEKEKTKYLG
jgi:RNA polymerase sigma-70 factor (ECF subfamily)